LNLEKFNIKLYEDLYEGCFVKGHHVVNKKEAKRLRTVIALLKRISADNYDEWHYYWLDKKYGSNEYYFKSIPGTENRPGGPYSTMGDTRTDRLTKEQNETYIKDRKAMWKLEEYQRKQDLKLLGEYIAKYSRRWWD